MKSRNALWVILVLGLTIGWMSGTVWAEPIKIGACMPITGPFSFAGKHINQGLADYITYANEQGGVNGQKIEYIFEDTGYDTKRAIASFKKIIAQHNPQIMYGESTGLAKAMSEEITERYKVLYGGCTFSDELSDRSKHPYIFISGPTYAQMFGVLLEYIAENPKHKGKKPTVAFFYADSAFGRDPIPYAREKAKALGIEVVAEEVTKSGAIDVTSQILDLKRNNPDYCIFQGYVVPPMPDVIRGARDYGLDTTFMGTFWSMSKMLLDKLGPDGDGFMGVCPFAYWYDDVPMIQEMKAFHKKHHPGVDYRPIYYTQAWFTGMIYVKALKMLAEKGLPLTGENLKDMIPRIQDWDTGGLAGKVSFRSTNATAMGRVYKAQGGKFLPVSDWIYLEK